MRLTFRNDLLLLFALTATLLFAILLVAAPPLSELDVGSLGGTAGDPVAADAVRSGADAGPPAWVSDPVEPPLAAMEKGGTE